MLSAKVLFLTNSSPVIFSALTPALLLLPPALHCQLRWYNTSRAHQQEPQAANKGERNPIDVQKYILNNYTPYFGDGTFLQGPTDRTLKLWSNLQKLIVEEQKKGVLDVDPKIPSTITAFGPGYISKSDEKIVGLQCDAPLKRAIKPYGGWNMVKNALEAYGFQADLSLQDVFTKHRKTHNQGCFDAYTREMKAARQAGILSGLPDGYGRGRIIGDYRRVALYGVDYLIDQKKQAHDYLSNESTEMKIRLREEVAEQIRALQELKVMASAYGDDISKPATSARQAVQWLYYGFLGAVKQQDGAAMSLGRVDAFLDTYIEDDMQKGLITEEEAQELIDQFVMKLRIVRQLRTPDYNRLFAGDPTWVTAVLGGMTLDHKPLVTKTSFRFLQTFRNLGPAPEPNATILWDPNLPEPFRKFAAKISIESSCLQYENDVAMRALFGSDYAIACCVSAMRVGKDMQFFGARCNLAKLLLYTLNQGRDEISGKQVGPLSPPVLINSDGSINFDSLVDRFTLQMGWMARVYADTMNVIHYMHDHHCYESLQMALHDTDVRRFMAFGISGLSVVADSLSAVKHAKVFAVRDGDSGLYKKFEVVGEYPAFGNDDERVDELARWTVDTFSDLLGQQHVYRNSIPTLSVLTITSNVVYGKVTGDTPDGRLHPQPFAPGANPMHGRDKSGAIASLNSVAKLPYAKCLDGISNTFTLLPTTLGKGIEARVDNLVALLNGYFQNGGHHLNVNVLDRSTLEDAVEHPEKYPNLTVRVSGYAVHFNKLTGEQKREVIQRTFHDQM